MNCLPQLGKAFKAARKDRYPKDRLEDFACRICVGRATLQKMDKGDLSVSINSYYRAAQLLKLTDGFEKLFHIEKSLFDDW